MPATPRFLDLHIVQAVPFANLNRDDMGAPKELSYGGATRMRVSSQCYKRATRTKLQELTNGADWDFGSRSRAHGEQIAEELQHRGWPERTAQIAARDLFTMLDDKDDEAEAEAEEDGGRKQPRKKHTAEEDEASKLLTNVLLYLNDSDIPRLADLAEAHREDYQRAADSAPEGEELPTVHGRKDKKWQKELLKVLKECTGAGLALFGRMIAALPEGRIDGASQVAHAFTTHEAKFEVDYFTAVDDLLTGKESSGSAHLGTAEYASGVFYRYATLDLGDLAAYMAQNADGIRAAAELAGLFLRAFALAVPSGKRTSTAPHTPPALVYASMRSDHPVSLAAAFEGAVQPGVGGHLPASLKALGQHVTEVENFFGPTGRVWHAHAATISADQIAQGVDKDAAGFGDRLPLPDLAAAVTEHTVAGAYQ
ncbi:type I-E CRISPR-associated protein Cas7/Cse4/CasC [Allosalinactinospora lopnorensis]|uniref:type I-E CRISPR-associated protein Cas7/Cse4/CasC n=1 Tax=Allosalinactinospora lopnorensis TaxID=1352348 RepID=UPI000698794E|nr:type I-E CRISPR-associated protein Cas7/Cse4/CasC [Allosalinactinospora lopnorensis]